MYLKRGSASKCPPPQNEIIFCIIYRLTARREFGWPMSPSDLLISSPPTPAPVLGFYVGPRLYNSRESELNNKHAWIHSF